MSKEFFVENALYFKHFITKAPVNVSLIKNALADKTCNTEFRSGKLFRQLL
jgi:hypothetical protein